MKFWWALGCVYGIYNFAELALKGNGIFGGEWWARGLDWVTAACFAAALVVALRQRVPWLTPWRDE